MNTQLIKTLSALAALGAVVALAACENVGGGFDQVSTLWSKPIVYNCPDYRILKDAARLVAFKPGPGRDLIDVEAQASIGDARLECLTFVDKETKKGYMEAHLKVLFGARRGPANKTRRAVFPYFVSVTDKNKNVLYREALKIAVRFPGNQTTVQFAGEMIKLELPLSTDIKSSDYIIFIGFVLNHEQLKFNRENQR